MTETRSNINETKIPSTCSKQRALVPPRQIVTTIFYITCEPPKSVSIPLEQNQNLSDVLQTEDLTLQSAWSGGRRRLCLFWSGVTSLAPKTPSCSRPGRSSEVLAQHPAFSERTSVILGNGPGSCATQQSRCLLSVLETV